MPAARDLLRQLCPLDRRAPNGSVLARGEVGGFRSIDSACAITLARVCTIRRAVQEDSRAIWALNDLPNLGATADPSSPLELLPPSEPPAAFPDLEDVTKGFIDRDGEFLVSEHEGHVVGMGGYRPEDADAVEIMRVRVHPAMRRRHIGADLMAELERRARAAGFREVRLNTATNMPEAIAFYQALGYTETGLESRLEWSWTLMHFAKPLA